MKQTTSGLIGAGLIAVLLVLVLVLPVSGAGKTGPQDGTGNFFGLNHQSGQNNGGDHMGLGNGDCIREDCPHAGTRPQDGTGVQFGRSDSGSGKGKQSGQNGQGKGRQAR